MGQGPLVSQPLDAATRFASPRPVSGTDLDHCYAGWQGSAKIIQPETGLQIGIRAIRGANYCVIYTPTDPPCFCFEPVSHSTAAFEAPDPEAARLKLLRPCEEFVLAIAIEAGL
jgi:aldose 1-epimerase